MKNRVNIAKELEADIFVSIHLNKIPQKQYYGWQCFYNTKNLQNITHNTYAREPNILQLGIP